MKKIFWSLFFILLISTSLKAQKVYFIYLQTENQQPFYTRIGEKIYNSTSAGYLILSNLRDSNYSISVGMQGSQVPDQPYSVAVNKKDQGFLIKNFGEKGWGLFNLSTMAIIMPSNPVSAVQTIKTEKTEDNAFTNLLAKAADDSTIKEKPIIEKKTETTTLAEEKKGEPKSEVKEVSANESGEKSQSTSSEKKEDPKVDPSSNKNSVGDVKNNDALKTGIITGSTVAVVDKTTDKIKDTKRADSLEKQDTVVLLKPDSINVVEYKKSNVKLKSESSTTTGIGLIFLDMISDNIIDTIQILIPAAASQVTPIASKPEEKKFLDIASVDSTVSESKTVSVKSNNCKAVAIEDDFYKLRKKMASQKNDDDMITEAKKTFKTKCFSTIQIRNLNTLFLTDESKYKFFDAAYQYVSDLENFSTLQSTLKEEYYINRFKAMLRQY